MRTVSTRHKVLELLLIQDFDIQPSLICHLQVLQRAELGSQQPGNAAANVPNVQRIKEAVQRRPFRALDRYVKIARLLLAKGFSVPR